MLDLEATNVNCTQEVAHLTLEVFRPSAESRQEIAIKFLCPNVSICDEG